jgi:hypothetical protein
MIPLRVDNLVVLWTVPHITGIARELQGVRRQADGGTAETAHRAVPSDH